MKKQTAIRLAEEHHQMRSGTRQYQNVAQVRGQRFVTQKQSHKQYNSRPPNAQFQNQQKMYQSRPNRYPVNSQHLDSRTNTSVTNQMQKPMYGNHSTLPKPINHSIQQNQTQYTQIPYQRFAISPKYNGNQPFQQNTEIFDENSSLNSDLEISSSIPDFNEAPIVSGSNSLQHFSNPTLNSSLQAAAGKVNNSIQVNNNLRFVHNSIDVASVVSTSSSKGSSKGGSSINSLTIPSSVYSRANQQQQNVKQKQHSEVLGHQGMIRHSQPHQVRQNRNVP